MKKGAKRKKKKTGRLLGALVIVALFALAAVLLGGRSAPARNTAASRPRPA